MTHVDTTHTTARHHRHDEARPLALLVMLMRENPSAPPAKLRAIFKARILEEQHDDHLQRLHDEWLDLNFNNAHRAAFPPTEAELKARHLAREAEREAAKREQAELERKIADGIAHLVLLDLMMPNGKPLRECTGAECSAFGGWFRKIGANIGADVIVGMALTEDELHHLWSKSSR